MNHPYMAQISLLIHMFPVFYMQLDPQESCHQDADRCLRAAGDSLTEDGLFLGCSLVFEIRICRLLLSFMHDRRTTRMNRHP